MNLQSIADQLEPLVDAHGESTIIEALALVMSAKSDHILEAWQDERLADLYDMASAALLNCNMKIKELLG